MLRNLLVGTAIIVLCMSSAAVAQQSLPREQQVRRDKQDFLENDAWFYDDLDAAIDEANRTKRPLILVFR